MRRFSVWKWMLALSCLPFALGAAPAAPSYHGVTKTIETVRSEWAKPDGPEQPNATGWNTFFDALNADLQAYANAQNENDRLAALGRIYEMTLALDGVAWQPAQELRTELRAWLRPRTTLAWAIRRLTHTVKGLPESSDSNVQSNRQQWIQFVDSRLGQALRKYEAASSVADRVAALDEVRDSLGALQGRNQSSPWNPSLTLESALADLFDVPNLNVSVTPNVLQSAVARMGGVVLSGPIAFKGQVSYSTPGPIVGAGFLPSSNGIGIYISQSATTVTPIRGFQQQVAADDKGRRAAKLYYFNATSQDNNVFTVSGLFTLATGLQLSPSFQHGISAAIGSMPKEGKGFGRFIAKLVGYGQPRITQEVYEGAIGQIQQGVVQGAAELSHIKIAEKMAQANAKIAPFVVNGETAGTGHFGVTNLRMSSSPSYALVNGRVVWLGLGDEHGGSAPQPARFRTIQNGITADVHLGSILTNLSRGFLQSDRAQGVENLMILTGQAGPDAQPSEQVKVEKNVDYATYLQAVKDARAANDPKVQAIRVYKPSEPPRFAADSRGYLVAIVPGMTIEVPAPEQATQGGGLGGPAAQVYRIVAPRAEFQFSFTIEPGQGANPPELKGTLQGFEPGQGVKVYAINEDEQQAQALNAFTANIIAAAVSTKLKGRPLEVQLNQLQRPGLALGEVSPLDPSGWMRIVLLPR